MVAVVVAAVVAAVCRGMVPGVMILPLKRDSRYNRC